MGRRSVALGLEAESAEAAPTQLNAHRARAARSAYQNARAEHTERLTRARSPIFDRRALVVDQTAVLSRAFDVLAEVEGTNPFAFGLAGADIGIRVTGGNTAPIQAVLARSAIVKTGA